MTTTREPAPALGRREMLRWSWRQLTSMRTALILLLLLAIAAVPGSLVPQSGVDARAVETYRLDHPALAPWLDRLGAFSVYTSPWFSAIYLLLMVSLVGCIVPRSIVYAKAVRARPPKAPKNFDRLPASATFETSASVDDVLVAGRRAVGRARIDVVDSADGGEVRAESGHLRETGNLIFHISVVLVLVGVAVGALYGYRGSAIVTEGDGFSNTLTQYDDFGSGALFDPDDLPPFSMQVDAVDARFQMSGPQRGAPRLFAARGEYEPSPGLNPRPFDIRVNHPLKVGGTSVFLVGQGYAPVVKVTDAEGDVAFEDAVPFLPSDGTYTSTGVVKVPDARPEGLGFQGFFLPTAVSTGEKEAPVSVFPAAANPLVGLFVYRGDLGVDDGTPQSVFVLDKDDLTQEMNDDGSPFRVSLSPGQVADLPGGGTIQLVGVKQFARLQISSSPLVQLPLIAIAAGVLGLILSLSIKPRRTWIRAQRKPGGQGSRTVVEVAVLDRVPRGDLPSDLDDFLKRLHDELRDEERA
ncbi:cytochrome c biogenesis protein ResB [Aeromicrobium sp.]|uniref:cytochrome c biogenesis protein ResB n=1 Tax=Aeromicrobium sp. TaxID=1871063 RepID=UPI003C3FD27E